MVEAGLDIYWKKLYRPPSGGKCGDIKQSDVGPKSLSLIDLQGAFIILAIGSGMAFVIFLIERFPPFFTVVTWYLKEKMIFSFQYHLH